MSTLDEVKNAKWPETLDKNFFGVYYNRGVVSEDLDAEQSKIVKRFIGNRKETISSICAVDDKADMIVKKPPVKSKDKNTMTTTASSKENRRIVTATRKLPASNSGNNAAQVRTFEWH